MEYSVDFLFDGGNLVHVLGRSNTFATSEYVKGAVGWGRRNFFHPTEEVKQLLAHILRPIQYVGIGCFQFKMKESAIKVAIQYSIKK